MGTHNPPKIGEMIMLYRHLVAHHNVSTVQGLIPYGEFLLNEKKRIEKNPNRTVEIRSTKKKTNRNAKEVVTFQSLWVDNVVPPPTFEGRKK